MIDVHLLRYALAAAETGSFSRAADRFRVKQSTLSKRIRDLEIRMGLMLFERSTQGVAPTHAGQRFLVRAQAIMCDLDALSSETVALASGQSGFLRIGFQGSLAAGCLQAAIKAFCDACPDVELEATEGGCEQLLARVDRDLLDVAIVAGAHSARERRSLYLWSEALVIGMARDYPIEHGAPLHWTDLRDATFLVTRADPGPLITAMIRARLSGPNADPRIVAQSVSSYNLPSLVRDECVTVTVGDRRSADPAIRFSPVQDAFGPTRLDQGMHWREDNANPALRRFLELTAQRHGCAAP